MMMQLQRMLRFFILSAFLLGTSAFAQDVYWNNPAGGNWSNANNWDTGVVPTTEDNVHITTVGTYTVSLDINVDIASLEIGGSSDTQTLSSTGRIITLNGASSVNTNGQILLTTSQINGSGLLTNTGRMEFSYNNIIDADINNDGVIEVIRTFQFNNWNGNLTTQPGSVFRVDGRTSTSAMTFANGFTNNGLLELYATNNHNASLAVTNGQIVNAAGATIRVDGNYNRVFTLNASVDNQGTIEVNRSATFNKTHEQTGNLIIADDRLLTYSSATMNYNGGPVTGNGSLAFVSSTLNSTVANLPTRKLTFQQSTLSATLPVTNTDTLEFSYNNIIDADINNDGVIEVIRTFQFNNWNGNLTTQPGSVFRVDGRTSTSAMTFANGFTNNGLLELYATNNHNASLAVTNGQIVNAAGATIRVDGNYNRVFTLASSLLNQGTLEVLSSRNMTLNGSSLINESTGLLRGNGQITIGGFLDNRGKIDPGENDIASLNFNGSVQNEQTASYDLEIESLANFDNSSFTASPKLDGTLNINLLNGYQPAFGDSFVVMNYPSATDTFETITGQDIGNGVWLNPKYRNGNLVLLAGNPPAAPTYDITSSSGPNGSISPDGVVTVDLGFDRAYTITPISGYQVEDVLVDDVSVGAVTSYTFTAVNANHTISATFEPQTYQIITTAGTGGTISPNGTVNAIGGSDQLFTIAPNIGYHILDVTVDGQALGAVSSYQFTNVTANHTIEATFELNSYPISAQAGSGGTISPAGNVFVDHGVDQVFQIAASIGFEIEDVFVDGASIGAVSVYEFVSVDQPHTIQAIFQQITHSITVSSNFGGQVLPNGTVIVTDGADQTFQFIPDPGYAVDWVEVDGNNLATQSEYTFSNVTEDHAIQVEFYQLSFSINASAGANGVITPNGNLTVPGGENRTFDITPDTGFNIEDVVVDGVSLGPLSSYTFGNIAANHTITASFIATSYPLVSSAGNGGSISPSGLLSVAVGGDAFYTITPDVDYNIGEVYVDGQPIGPVGDYLFDNVNAPHSIAAFFAPENFNYTGINTGSTDSLTGVVFTDSLNGYIVGENGLLLITIDGGSSWTTGNIGISDDLTSITVINDTLFVTGANGHICYSVDGGLTWLPTITNTSETFYSASFTSGTSGYAVSAGGIYYWNGVSWIPQNLGINTTFYGIYTVGPYAYAVGVNGICYYWNGVSWGPINIGATGSLYGAYFLNVNYGYIVGSGGIIYRTINGGGSWTTINTGVNLTIYNIHIVDDNNAWAVCEGGVILQTIDGGTTWEVITTGAPGSLAGITFINGTGYVVGAGGTGFTFESNTVQQDPIFAISDTNISFDEIAVGYSSSNSVTVYNNGYGVLTLSVSSDNAEFSFNPTATSIAAGDSLSFQIIFSPLSAGGKSGNITFSHNAVSSPDIVTVSGSATESGLTITPISIGSSQNLTGVAFVNATLGYAVGSGGVLFITYDGGGTWTAINTGTVENLTGVSVIGDVVFITGANGLICASYDGGLTWTPFVTNTTANFYASSFVNPYYGFAVGSGGVICIYNGTNWVAQSTGTSESFNSVYTYGQYAWAVGTNGIICKYVNGFWLPQTSGTNVNFHDVAFWNASLGFAVGANGTICKTNDGGSTWTPLNSGVTFDITGCKIFSPGVIWATCANGTLLQSLDSGLTWTIIPINNAPDLAGLDFSGCQGFIVGASGAAYQFSSTVCDLAINPPFVRQTTGFYQDITGCSFTDPLNGCITGIGGTVLVTSDGGLTWTFSNTGTNINLTGVQLIGNAAFITGLNGVICVSYDGGATWTPFTTNTNASFYASSFTNVSSGYAVGSAGTICYYNGASWSAQTTGLSTAFYGVFAYGNTAWAVGENGVICRYIGGSWTPQVTNTTVNFFDVAFLNSRFGYAVGANGTICRTNDGGITWEPLVSGTTQTLRGCKIISPRVAYCIGDDGLVLETTDCGDTWAEVALGYPLALEALDIVDGSGFVVGDLGEAFSFTNSAVSDIQLFALNSNNLDFASTAIGTSNVSLVRVINNGTALLDVSEISVDAAEFSLASASLAVAPGDSADLEITFTPSALGTTNGTVLFTHDASCEIDTVYLAGSGISLGYNGLATGTTTNLKGVSFIDPLNGCIVGANGTLRITTDGGDSWSDCNTGTTENLNAIKLIGNSSFIAGDNGLLCRSDNGGQSWLPFTTNTTANFYGVSFLNPGYGFAAGANGTICFYSGIGWSVQPTNTSITFYGIYAVGTTAYAVGENGTICRYNGGGWSPLTSGVNLTFYDCAFVSETFGYAVGENGTICRTRDGGITWEPLVSGTDETLRACKIVSPRVAYCSGDNGVILKTEDCGDTWEIVPVGSPVVLEGLEFIQGQGFTVGDLGEAFSFSQPELASYPVFELASSNIDFGTINTWTVVPDTIKIYNPGTSDLVINNISASSNYFLANPDSAVIPAGDSLCLEVVFCPGPAGDYSDKITFMHEGSCEVDTLYAFGSAGDIATGPGVISGTVFINNIGLPGVTVSLLDTSGLAYDSINYPPITTDADGSYLFSNVPADSYQVSIVTPLGYAVDRNPQETLVAAEDTSIVDFYLTEEVTGNHARPASYWKYQFSTYICSWGNPQETEQELNDYIDTVHERYTPHFNVFAEKTTFRKWRRLLKVGCRASTYKRARRQLAALVLNFASLKIGQYTVVTEDGRTAGDVLTYCSILLSDGNSSNDGLAKTLAKKVNTCRIIGSGIVPASNILYKDGEGLLWDFEALPETFALGQNYPNPFNPTTNISFDLPKAQFVTLAVYNVLGQQVATLVNEQTAAGSYTLQFDARNLASGIYIYRLQTEGFIKVRKMLLTR
ncbi:MAG: YCF48-related protein [Calditrichia bacterium]